MHIRKEGIHYTSFSAPILELTSIGNFIFVGTEGTGLYAVDKKSHSKTRVISEGVSIAYSIIDVNHNYYIASNSGFYNLDIRDSSLEIRKIFSVQDLNIGEFNRKVIAAYKGGVLLGGTRGLYYLDLNQQLPKSPNRFLVDKILIDEKAVPLPNLRATTSRQLLTLQKTENTLQFDFELISPLKKFQQSVHYILDGKAVPVSPQSRSFSITNLTPGTHELSIKLLSKEGIVLDSIDFSIDKKAPFYRYAAFQFLTVIVLLALISVIIVVNLQARKREIKIQLLETEKQLLSSKARESKALLDKRNTELEFQLIKTSNRVEILREFRSKFGEILRRASSSEHVETSLRDLQRTLDRELKNETYWDGLQDKYYRINEDVVSDLKTEFPQLTKGDLDFVLLLKKNLSSKEIAALLNITVYAVRKRKYRIKKKLNLPEEENLLSHLENVQNSANSEN